MTNVASGRLSYPLYLRTLPFFTVMWLPMLQVEGYPIHFENVTFFHSYVITNVASGRLSYTLFKTLLFPWITVNVIISAANGRLSYPLWSWHNYLRNDFPGHELRYLSSGVRMLRFAPLLLAVVGYYTVIHFTDIIDSIEYVRLSWAHCNLSYSYQSNNTGWCGGWSCLHS